MKKRYTVFGLSVFLAVALAVPAFGGPSNPIAQVAGGGGKALKKAKKGIRLAQGAQTSADNAQGTANSAVSQAQGAQTTADAAQAAAAAAQAAADSANANANNRFRDAVERSGTRTASNTTLDKAASANCPTGETPLGGGFSVGGTTSK